MGKLRILQGRTIVSDGSAVAGAVNGSVDVMVLLVGGAIGLDGG